MSFARIPPLAYYEIMVTHKEIPPRTLVIKGLPSDRLLRGVRADDAPEIIELSPSKVEELCNTREKALAALGLIPSHHSIPALAAAMRDDSADSARMKPYIDRGPAAIPELISLLLEEKSEKMQLQIAKAIVLLGGGKEALMAMRKLAFHYPLRRNSCVRVIQFIGERMAKPAPNTNSGGSASSRTSFESLGLKNLSLPRRPAAAKAVLM